MVKFKLKSFCKINLSLRILRKLSRGYHAIQSLVAFTDLHDTIVISEKKGPRDSIIFSGQFTKGIDKKFNTISKTLNLLRKMKQIRTKRFKLNIKKNIPPGSGLGGGSANAATIINFLYKSKKIKLKKKLIYKLANKIGSDVPILLKKTTTLITGNRDKIVRYKKNFKLIILIVYPNVNCSTERVYSKNKNFSRPKPVASYSIRSKSKLIDFLKSEPNDLEESTVKIYPIVRKIINIISNQRGCYFSRLTGSGSACFGVFTSVNNAIIAQRFIKKKFPQYWCVVSKTI